MISLWYLYAALCRFMPRPVFRMVRLNSLNTLLTLNSSPLNSSRPPFTLHIFILSTPLSSVLAEWWVKKIRICFLVCHLHYLVTRFTKLACFFSSFSFACNTNSMSMASIRPENWDDIGARFGALSFSSGQGSHGCPSTPQAQSQKKTKKAPSSARLLPQTSIQEGFVMKPISSGTEPRAGLVEPQVLETGKGHRIMENNSMSMAPIADGFGADPVSSGRGSRVVHHNSHSQSPLGPTEASIQELVANKRISSGSNSHASRVEQEVPESAPAESTPGTSGKSHSMFAVMKKITKFFKL